MRSCYEPFKPIANMATSSASSDSSPSNSDNCVPTDIDGNPIILERNPAYVEGVLHEIDLWTSRGSNKYRALIEEHCFVTGSKTSIDNPNNSLFVSGQITDTNTYDLKNPCPGSVERLRIYNDAQTALGTPVTAAVARVPADLASDYTVNKICLLYTSDAADE